MPSVCFVCVHGVGMSYAMRDEFHDYGRRHHTNRPISLSWDPDEQTDASVALFTCGVEGVENAHALRRYGIEADTPLDHAPVIVAFDATIIRRLRALRYEGPFFNYCAALHRHERGAFIPDSFWDEVYAAALAGEPAPRP